MTGDHVCGYVRYSGAHMVTKHTIKDVDYMYGLMTVDERLGHVVVGISTPVGSELCMRTTNKTRNMKWSSAKVKQNDCEVV